VSNIPYNNTLLNVYDAYGIFPNSLPAKAKVPNYGQVKSVAERRHFGLRWADLQHPQAVQELDFRPTPANTWSHNLDEASNGGVSTYGDSLFGQFNPISLRSSNYGSSDYDFRHSFVADFVVNPSFHAKQSGREATGQWLAALGQVVSGAADFRSGSSTGTGTAGWATSNATLLATPHRRPNAGQLRQSGRRHILSEPRPIPGQRSGFPSTGSTRSPRRPAISTADRASFDIEHEPVQDLQVL